MTYSVYQHWDPLKVCVVGRSYPPEFYSWINVPHVRSLFEKIAVETEEDYQAIIKKLQEFGVKVMRPKLPNAEDCFVNGQYIAPPMTPRDYNIMIGDTYYCNYNLSFRGFYQSVKDPSWPNCNTHEEFINLPKYIQQECIDVHGYEKLSRTYSVYDHILSDIKEHGGKVAVNDLNNDAPGAMISRIGRDLYVGTKSYDQDTTEYKKYLNNKFPNYRTQIVNTGGHSDGTYCPVCPGLIISLNDVPTYADTFPDWEVVYLPNQSWGKITPFLQLKLKNGGKWWIPGFEHDNEVINVVELWLGHWTGYVEETVFDVNMLIIDPKNVIVFNYNKQVFDALDRYGITPHVVPFRHRYFWDGGIHCITSDIHREGTMQDYFPERNK